MNGEMDLAICWRYLAWVAAVVILGFELHGATAQHAMSAATPSTMTLPPGLTVASGGHARKPETLKGRRTSDVCLESLQDTYQPEDQLHEAWNDIKAYGACQKWKSSSSPGGALANGTFLSEACNNKPSCLRTCCLLPAPMQHTSIVTTTTPMAIANNYRKEPGVGSFGGLCSCPDGSVYEVGDIMGSSCSQLACEGGIWGHCDDGTISAENAGMKVTCADPVYPNNLYGFDSRAGSWGGICTCPDGRAYGVGDVRGSDCGSLSCVGGISGTCANGGIRPEEEGFGVICAPAPTTPNTTNVDSTTTHCPCVEPSPCLLVNISVHSCFARTSGQCPSITTACLPLTASSSTTTHTDTTTTHKDSTTTRTEAPTQAQTTAAPVTSAPGTAPAAVYNRALTFEMSDPQKFVAASGAKGIVAGSIADSSDSVSLGFIEVTELTATGSVNAKYTVTLPGGHSNPILTRSSMNTTKLLTAMQMRLNAAGIDITVTGVTVQPIVQSAQPLRPAGLSGAQVEEAEQAEASLLKQLRASMSSSVAMAPSAPVVIRSADSTSVAKSLETSRQRGENATITVPGDSVSVTVPAAVVAQLGADVAIVVTAFDANVSMNMEGNITSRTALAVPAVSVRLVSVSNFSDIMPTQGFAETLRIELGTPTMSGAQCAFWDTSAEEWVTRGLLTTLNADGRLVCMTPHLTLFSAVLRVVEKVVKCANARVLTKEGLSALSRADWWYQPAALILWMLLAVFGGLLGVACASDVRQSRKLAWKDEMFLTSHPRFEHHEGLVTTMKEKVADYTTSAGIVQLSAQQCIASRKKIDISWLDQMMEHRQGALQKGSDADLAKQSSDETKHVDPLQKLMQLQSSLGSFGREGAILEDFFAAPFTTRAWILFTALHPVLQLWRFNVAVSSTSRLLLLGSRFLGALMMSCFFFQASGSATLQLDTSIDCSKKGFWAELLESAAIGLLSSLVSLLTLMILVVLQGRTFVYSAEWTRRKRCLYLCWWQLADVLLWIFALGYSAFSVLFVAAFLANVDSQSAFRWATSTFTVLFNTFLVTPMLTAMIFAVISAAAARRNPDLLHQVRDKLELSTEERAAKATANLRNCVGAAAKLGASSQLLRDAAKLEVSEVSDAESPAPPPTPPPSNNMFSAKVELPAGPCPHAVIAGLSTANPPEQMEVLVGPCPAAAAWSEAAEAGMSQGESPVVAMAAISQCHSDTSAHVTSALGTSQLIGVPEQHTSGSEAESAVSCTSAVPVSPAKPPLAACIPGQASWGRRVNSKPLARMGSAQLQQELVESLAIQQDAEMHHEELVAGLDGLFEQRLPNCPV